MQATVSTLYHQTLNYLSNPLSVFTALHAATQSVSHTAQQRLQRLSDQYSLQLHVSWYRSQRLTAARMNRFLIHQLAQISYRIRLQASDLLQKAVLKGTASLIQLTTVTLCTGLDITHLAIGLIAISVGRLSNLVSWPINALTVRLCKRTILPVYKGADDNLAFYWKGLQLCVAAKDGLLSILNKIEESHDLEEALIYYMGLSMWWRSSLVASSLGNYLAKQSSWIHWTSADHQARITALSTLFDDLRPLCQEETAFESFKNAEALFRIKYEFSPKELAKITSPESFALHLDTLKRAQKQAVDISTLSWGIPIDENMDVATFVQKSLEVGQKPSTDFVKALHHLWRAYHFSEQKPDLQQPLTQLAARLNRSLEPPFQIFTQEKLLEFITRSSSPSEMGFKFLLWMLEEGSQQNRKASFAAADNYYARFYQFQFVPFDLPIPQNALLQVAHEEFLASLPKPKPEGETCHAPLGDQFWGSSVQTEKVAGPINDLS